MTLLTPLFMQAGGADPTISYSATNYRYGLGNALFAVEGVINPLGSGGLQVTQRGAGANFSVDVAPGFAVITGNDIASQGVYICGSDATVNLVVPAAPGSGTRVHRVVAQVRDKLNNGSWTTYDWTPVLLPDIGSGTPAEPASATTLGLVSVSAGQASVGNANITDSRVWARPALAVTGALTIITAWASDDTSRPLTYRRTADGFVHLYGWVRRSASPFTATGGASFDFANIPAIARPSGIRDVIGATGIGTGGCVNMTVFTTGVITFTFRTTNTVGINDWFSLDGISYQL